jgi:predicted dehydrogenase/threonine dehydrogenase-like Zn-dependent dehydrogenase
MLQVAQNYKSGELSLIEVPVPACKPGGVLVRTRYSLISTGTELMKVSEASLSLLGKARSRPDQVAKVLASASSQGPVATYRKVTNKLDSWTPLGYSLCGVVTEVGAGVRDLTVGDLVAAAGNEHALHAEQNWIPRNLCTRVGPEVDPAHAAFATVGAIAMQGVRRAEPALGENALVLGLGLIGQLAVQLLVANGVRVLGADLSPQRCKLAEQAGALCAAPPGPALDNLIAGFTGGRGVDHVLITAGSKDAAPVELAVRSARDRGRVVDIGKCVMTFPWNAAYEKELDVRFSRSYGPGRYDPDYELHGRDYPAGYVRWTERRNLECFVDLVARGRLDIGSLISHVADFSDAVETYRRLSQGQLDAVAVLFRYPAPEDAPVEPAVGEGETLTGAAVRGDATEAPQSVPVAAPRRARPATRPLQVGFVGAGAYAGSMLLPHLTGRADVRLSRVVTTTALSAANAAGKFGFAAAGTDLSEVLEDPAIDAVFVVTRHSSHAELTARALRCGKAVFVEKPLALSEEEIRLVTDAVAESGNDRLHVGFNRRFAPLLRAAKGRLGRRVGPATVRYLVNAGPLGKGSWYTQTATEGSRFAGEGGHFLDTVTWLLGARPVSVFATATREQADLQILLRYDDDSTAAITYASAGSPKAGKEFLEVIADGKLMRLDDFRRATVHGPTRWSSGRLPVAPDKGQRGQLEAFTAAVLDGTPMPIRLESLLATTRATLAVARSLATGGPVAVEPARVALPPVGVA